MPATERPRERFVAYGPGVMSTLELIAIILGSGSKTMPVLKLAEELMIRFGSLPEIAEASIEEICQISGMGVAKAIQIKAALELGKRAYKPVDATKIRIQKPSHVYEILKDTLEMQHSENFVVVLLDTKGMLIGHQTVSVGTLSKTLVHPREVFHPAIRRKAASVIIAHNHPSGDPSPSEEDLTVTEQLVQSGKTLGIPVHDHVIIGKNKYCSLREKGIKFL